MPKAGVITIDVDAGTAQFLIDMNKSAAAVKQFGQDAQQSGMHLVSSMQSSSAAIRLLENPLGNNIRAVERFITLLPGMGRLLQAAFPLVGAIAFGDILLRLGSNAINFFQKMEQAPQRIADAFREITEPLTLSNDELALATDRIRANIAKLDGKEPNNVAIALDEARVNADHLAESLDKDLESLRALLEKEGGSGEFFQSLFTNSRSVSGDDQGIERLKTQLAAARYTANQNGDKASDPEAKKAAMLAGELEQRRLINEEIGRRNKLIGEAQGKQKDRGNGTLGVDSAMGIDGSGLPNVDPTNPDQTRFIASQQKTVGYLQAASNQVQGRIDNASAEGEQGKKEVAKTTAEQQAQIRLADIENQEKTNAMSAALDREKAEAQVAAQHEIRQAKIAAWPEARDRVVMEAAEELQVEQDKATRLAAINKRELDTRVALLQEKVAPESVGKSQLQQQEIQTKFTGAGGEVDQAKAEAAQKSLALFVSVDAAQAKLEEATVARNREGAEESASAWREAYDAITKATKETADAQRAAVDKQILTQARVSEINDKGQGNVNAAVTQEQKLAAERDFGQQLVHNGEQQVAYAQRIAGIESQERAQKLAGVQAELADAEALDVQARDVEKIATLKQQIALLSQENANADQAAATAVDELTRKLTQTLTLRQQISNATNAMKNTAQSNQQRIGQQLGQTLGNVPKDIGDDIGGAISTALLSKHPGKSIGQEMGDAMVQALKQTAASVLKSLISSGVQFGLGFLGFADGGDPPVGRTVMVGEHGPELIRLKSPGTVIPNHNLNAYLQRNSGMDFSQYSAPGLSRYPNLPSARGFSGAGPTPSSSSSGGHTFHNTFHIYDASDPQEVARTMADYLQLAVANTTKFSR